MPYVPPQNWQGAPTDGGSSIAQVENTLQKLRRSFDATDENVKEMRNNLSCIEQKEDVYEFSIKHLELKRISFILL